MAEPRYTVERRNAAESAARFQTETAHHQMTVLHDDGLYRHLRFRNPANGSYWFDLTTWPGYLAITGDIDGFVFARTRDMFAFFRQSDAGLKINPGYWQEKVVAGRDNVKEYSEAMLRWHVIDDLTAAVEGGDAPRGLGKAIREQVLEDPDICLEDGARAAVNAFEYEGFQFADTWEWDLADYSWCFLWACHAIVWGIGQYDTWRAPKGDVAPAEAVGVGR